MAYDLRRIIALAAKHGPDMTKPEVTGEYTPPAKGIAHARFIGYFELGLHEKEYEGKKSFELSGPNHEPTKHADGTRTPIRITSRENISFTAKSHFFKLFGAMNYAGKATHMAELLGEPFVVEIFHTKSADGKKTYANLRGPNGYNVKVKSLRSLAPAMTEIRAFIWDFADRDMWDSIHIPGEYPERKDDMGVVTSPAKSKNLIQDLIMSAGNWQDHPVYADVVANGVAPVKAQPK